MTNLSFRTNLLFASIFFVWLLSGCSQHSATLGSPVFGTAEPTKPRSSKAVHRATLRPYTVNGKRYYPTVVSVGWRQDGVASWYGPNFHGGKTSNGETYNMYELTAAHKTLPMNTMVRVTNKRNGRSVVVRINDRGPFVKGRIVDLSYTAGKRIGIDKTGTAPVRLTVLGFDNIIASMAKASGHPVRQEVVLSGFGVQVGAFRRYAGALTYRDRYDNFEGRYHTKVKKFIVDGEPLYRVWLMGFKSEEEARDFIKAWNIPGAFIIRGSS
ncbi:septal ring lytic transglycosylase RlpA family protein [Hydrogenimonas sp.]|uniref:septal ring lytic transglycosylase RlpA family protein n=1 Tax=Hydrogenimonas sp. TaxID=2231112 RepID=UPI0034520340